MKDYAAIALEYAEQVTAGKIIACRWVKLACQRFLDDLAQQDNVAFPYRFDTQKAGRICRFAERLPHVKGKWLRKKETLKLEPWQCFILANIFGWLKKPDGFRRYTTALIYIPRKNGKSFLAAVIALYLLKFDNEPAAEIVCGASTEAQANYVFRPAQQIVQKSAGLRAKGLKVLANAVVDPTTGSRLETCIGQPLDGANPSGALLDEAHEWANDLLLSTMQTGMVAREQPLIVVTTTAGYNTAGPAKLMQDDLQAVLEGTVKNEELFGVIYTMDVEDDWQSELALRKANPNWGVSVDPEKIRSAQAQAVQLPRKQVDFKTKHLNLWVHAAVVWIPADKWAACGDSKLSLDDFVGEACYAGLDAASKLDLTAYVLLFQKLVEGKPHYYLFPRFYLPEAQVDDPANGHYRQWAGYGYLETVPGASNDQTALKQQILEDAKRFDIKQLAHDPYGIPELINGLMDEGINCVEMQQKWQFQSPAMKELESLVVDNAITHNCNPCMTWCLANTYVKTLPNNCIVPRKEHNSSTKKVDGTVATIMALRQAMIQPVQPVWNTPEVW